MFLKTSIVALVASVASAASPFQGFNYGSTNPDGSAALQADFQNYFSTAKNLVGNSGFTSARLYTMIQEGTTNSVIEAIPAAINTHTSLLLGMWASAGQENFDYELDALKSAIDTYGTKFTSLVAGLSVGSEDLYRITPIGIKSDAGPGATAETLVSYIDQTRKLLAGTPLSGVQIGHVDTWTAYVNKSNEAIIPAVDWLGVDTYPYFQTTDDNTIQNGKSLFEQAYQNTVNVAQGKDIWITETGWPISGKQSGSAIASPSNAKKYWDQVACEYLGKINMYWYTLYDGTPDPSFGLVGPTLSTQPVFNLACPKSKPKPQTTMHSTKSVKPSGHPTSKSSTSKPKTSQSKTSQSKTSQSKTSKSIKPTHSTTKVAETSATAHKQPSVSKANIQTTSVASSPSSKPSAQDQDANGSNGGIKFYIPTVWAVAMAVAFGIFL